MPIKTLNKNTAATTTNSTSTKVSPIKTSNKNTAANNINSTTSSKGKAMNNSNKGLTMQETLQAFSAEQAEKKAAAKKAKNLANFNKRGAQASAANKAKQTAKKTKNLGGFMENETKESIVTLGEMAGAILLSLMEEEPTELEQTMVALSPRGMNMEGASLYSLSDLGLGFEENEQGGVFYPGFQSSKAEDIKKREVETTLGKAQAYIELNASEFDKDVVKACSEELLILLHDQKLDEQENQTGFSYNSGLAKIKVQRHAINPVTGEDMWRNVTEIEIDELSDLFTLKGQRSILDIDRSKLKEILLGRGIKENELAKEGNAFKLERSIFVAEAALVKAEEEGKGPAASKLKTQIAILKNKLTNVSGSFMITTMVNGVDNNGFPCKHAISTPVRLIVSAPDTSRIEDENGNDVGTKEFFNHEIEVVCVDKAAKNISVNKLYDIKTYASIAKALKAGKVFKKEDNDSTLVGYSVTPVNGIKRFQPVASWIKIEQHDNGDFSVTCTKKGELFTPISIDPIYMDCPVYSVANTVKFFTPKTETDQERGIMSWMENLVTVDSEMNLIVSRGTTEISDEAIVKAEDTALIPIGLASTWAPAEYALYDSMWAERQALLADERVSNFYNKKASAAIVGKAKNIAKYYDQLIADNAAFIPLFESLNASDADVIKEYITRKGIDVKLLLRVAAAYKKQQNLKSGPINGNVYRTLRAMMAQSTPSKLTKAGNKRKSYSKAEALIVMMNDKSTRKEAVSQCKGKKAVIEGLIAVAEANFTAKKKARRLAKFQAEKGAEVSPINDADYPMFEGDAFRFVKELLSNVA